VRAFVVDTNVPLVANEEAEQAGLGCIKACVAALEEVVYKGKIVIDDKMLILHEYINRLSLSGQPGPGDAFVKWVFENQANTERCETVPVTLKSGDPDDLVEFPNDPDLVRFDRSDRKFVAVTLASKMKPTILNATDTDWYDARGALAKHGVKIDFLCPELMPGQL